MLTLSSLKEALKDLLPEACAELQPDDVIQNVVVRMAGENLIVDLMEKVGEINFFKAKAIPEKLDGVVIPVADLDTMIELKRGVRERDKKDFLFLTGKKDFLLKQKSKSEKMA